MHYGPLTLQSSLKSSLFLQSTVQEKITLHPSKVMKIIGPSIEIFEPISDTHLLDDVPTSVSVNCYVQVAYETSGLENAIGVILSIFSLKGEKLFSTCLFQTSRVHLESVEIILKIFRTTF